METVFRNTHSNVSIASNGARIENAGAIFMRCALALIFLWFGSMKFTSYEATGVA